MGDNIKIYNSVFKDSESSSTEESSVERNEPCLMQVCISETLSRTVLISIDDYTEVTFSDVKKYKNFKNVNWLRNYKETFLTIPDILKTFISILNDSLNNNKLTNEEREKVILVRDSCLHWSEDEITVIPD